MRGATIAWVLLVMCAARAAADAPVPAAATVGAAAGSDAARAAAHVVAVEVGETRASRVFGRFAPALKDAVPKDKLVATLGGLRRDGGALRGVDALDVWATADGTQHTFRLRMERGLPQLLRVALDEQQRVIALVVKAEPADVGAAARFDAVVGKTHLSFPLRGEWSAINAMRSPDNGHAMNANQRFAVDWLVRLPDGKSFTGTGANNTDYPAYHQEFLAPADGEVVVLVDGHADNQPNVERDRYAACGNFIVLDFGASEFGMFCHAAAGAFLVHRGDRVKRGQVLGHVGNSGNSTEPHLHFQMMDNPRLFLAHSFPQVFENVIVNGVPRARAVPADGDRMRAAEQADGAAPSTGQHP